MSLYLGNKQKTFTQKSNILGDTVCPLVCIVASSPLLVLGPARPPGAGPPPPSHGLGQPLQPRPRPGHPLLEGRDLGVGRRPLRRGRGRPLASSSSSAAASALRRVGPDPLVVVRDQVQRGAARGQQMRLKGDEDGFLRGKSFPFVQFVASERLRERIL